MPENSSEMEWYGKLTDLPAVSSRRGMGEIWEEWLLNFNMNQKHLEGLLKHKLQVSFPEFLIR